MKTNWNEPHKYKAGGFIGECACGLLKDNLLHLDAEAKKGVKKLEALDECKRCYKLNHKIKCLKLELEKHIQKTKHIDKSIIEFGITNVTIDPGYKLLSYRILK